MAKRLLGLWAPSQKGWAAGVRAGPELREAGGGAVKPGHCSHVVSWAGGSELSGVGSGAETGGGDGQTPA